MDNLRKILGERIRSARIRLSLSQKRLAEEAGFSALQTVQQIEKGKREVKAWELVNLARVLRMEVSDLLNIEEPQTLPVVLWRKYPQRDKELIEADFLRRCQQYALLEQLCRVAPERDLPERDVDPNTLTFEDAEQLAEDAQQEFNLGSPPARCLAGLLEDKYGVKIWYQDLGEEGSAASTQGSFGYAILMNAAEAPWRRNFNFAHEVFHLLTWRSIPSQLSVDNPDLWDRIEKFANTFASNLLLPAHETRLAFERLIKDDKISYSDIIGMAREFDISTAALLYRLVDLGLVDRDTVESLQEDSAFRGLDRVTMRNHWWTPPALPERFVRLAFIAYQKDKLSRARLAQYLDTSLFNLTDRFLEYGLDDRENYKTEVRASRR